MPFAARVITVFPSLGNLEVKRLKIRDTEFKMDVSRTFWLTRLLNGTSQVFLSNLFSNLL